MNKRLPHQQAIIVTGASGFIGRHLVIDFKDQFYIYALARRTQKTAHVPVHKNICWLRLDLAESDKVAAVFDQIVQEGGADYIIHLAGYYDFSNEPSPEYQRTNIDGTRHILENAAKLNLKRFIFTSSTTVTDFTKKRIVVNENSPTDAKFPYAISKAECERMIKKSSRQFPCAILRLAAIYSDWCEYGPLYVFLTTWLSGGWKSRIIAGRGTTAIPYLHIKDLIRLISRVINHSEELEPCPVLVAGANGSTNHNDLYHLALRYNFGREHKAIYIPKILSLFGVYLLDKIGSILGRRPFERPWMIKYVDKILELNSDHTQQILNWKPTARYHVLRRLLFLIENMKSNPVEWHSKNQEAILKSKINRPNLKIFEVMVNLEKDILSRLVSAIHDGEIAERLKTYRRIESEKLERRLIDIYAMLKTAVRSGDRVHVLSYAHNVAIERFVEGFESAEVVEAVNLIGGEIVKILRTRKELLGLEDRIHDEIMLTIQLIADEIQDSYDRITGVE